MTAFGGLRVKIRSGSVAAYKKEKAVHKNLGIKDILLMYFESQHSMWKETRGTLSTVKVYYLIEDEAGI